MSRGERKVNTPIDKMKSMTYLEGVHLYGKEILATTYAIDCSPKGDTASDVLPRKGFHRGSSIFRPVSTSHYRGLYWGYYSMVSLCHWLFYCDQSTRNSGGVFDRVAVDLKRADRKPTVRQPSGDNFGGFSFTVLNLKKPNQDVRDRKKNLKRAAASLPELTRLSSTDMNGKSRGRWDTTLEQTGPSVAETSIKVGCDRYVLQGENNQRKHRISKGGSIETYGMGGGIL